MRVRSLADRLTVLQFVGRVVVDGVDYDGVDDDGVGGRAGDTSYLAWQVQCRQGRLLREGMGD